MTKTQVNELLEELMNPTSFLDHVEGLFADPIDNLISLMRFPFDIPGGLADQTLIINIVELNTRGNFLGETIPQIFSFGAIQIPRYFNNFLDYSPYTKAEIFLPFIGYAELDVDMIVGKYISLNYVVDYSTGKCTAFVSVIDNYGTATQETTVIMVKDGQCGVQIQIAGGSGADIARSMGKIGLQALGAVAAGGGVSNVFGSVLDMKERVVKSGSTEAQNLNYAPMTAFIVFTRPVITEPSSYAHTFGRPSKKTETLGDLSGYTKVDRVHVEGTGFAKATDSERDEIEKLLLSGVIL